MLPTLALLSTLTTNYQVSKTKRQIALEKLLQESDPKKLLFTEKAEEGLRQLDEGKTVDHTTWKKIV